MSWTPMSPVVWPATGMLEEGDAVYFDSAREHSYAAAGDGAASALVVVTAEVVDGADQAQQQWIAVVLWTWSR
jgi:hypothetical protein